MCCHSDNTGMELIMNELKWIVWLFPLLFILHDMEEIVTAKQWCAHGYKGHIKLPFTPFGNTKNTAGFSIAVYEELILWCISAFIGAATGFYGLWFGLVVTNIAHLLLLHIIVLPISFRRYVPGEISAWLTVLPCCYILIIAQDTLQYSSLEIGLWVVIAVIIGFCNMKLLQNNIDKLASFIRV